MDPTFDTRDSLQGRPADPNPAHPGRTRHSRTESGADEEASDGKASVRPLHAKPPPPKCALRPSSSMAAVDAAATEDDLQNRTPLRKPPGASCDIAEVMIENYRQE